jgi:hypothetical protein
MTADANWAFSLHWTNDQELYNAVLDLARVYLRRVPGMTDQTLGRNIRDSVQRWCDERAASPLGWQEQRYPVSRSVLEMMDREVKAAGGFHAVNEEDIAEEVRELLAGEEA